ncbi:MAG TPA: amidase [Vicinamibacterales bacterium]|nr:amidase [Vicinamibacterales bacterium]
MTLSEYAAHDACGLAELVRTRQVSPKELADAAARAIDAVNPRVNAVVETYPDRIAGLDERTLGSGPFRGVPFLIKDFFGHEAGRRIEFGSRLCRGMVSQQDTYLVEMVRAAGVNIIGRSAAPEYSMSGTTENALYGNTSTPWRVGYSAGGSSGGAMAAVAAGMVPMAHGSDIAGSIRIPASFCGGVGLKPSRGRVSLGPLQDENGYGLGQNFVQTKSVRDAAAMLDCLSVPQVGDPFFIPKPSESYAALTSRRAAGLRIGWSTTPLMGVAVDAEVAQAVRDTAQLLETMGHHVAEASPAFDGSAAMRAMTDVWFFGFDLRLEGYAARSGHRIGRDTIEPVVFTIYEHARQMKSSQFVSAMAAINTSRRQLARFFTHYDVWLSPTTPRVAERWGIYNLGRTDVTMENLADTIYRGTCQFTLPHNIMGTPAISLPLAMHSAQLPIGIQIGAPHAQEHLVLQLASALEEARPWSARLPVAHASRADG